MLRRLYLSVGINKYPDPNAALAGCVNDANDLSATLDSAGYVGEKLLDSDATKANVVEALRGHIAAMGWGDRLVFHNSSHGTYKVDNSGDEADGRDEAICCYDYATGGLLLDDEVAEIAGNLKPGSAMLILSDSCHSGTMARAMDFDIAEVPGYSPREARFLSPAYIYDEDPVKAAMREVLGPDAAPRKTANLISGCADQEYSYDASFGGRPNGAFSRAAVDTYQGGMTLNAWHKAIRAKIDFNLYPQTPQLTATRYRRYTRAL